MPAIPPLLRRAFGGVLATLILTAQALAQANAPKAVAITITTGGTPQTIFDGDIPSGVWEVCNPDATNDAWTTDIPGVTLAANAAGAYRVPANGGCYISRGGAFGPVKVYGAVTGQKLNGRKW